MRLFGGKGFSTGVPEQGLISGVFEVLAVPRALANAGRWMQLRSAGERRNQIRESTGTSRRKLQGIPAAIGAPGSVTKKFDKLLEIRDEQGHATRAKNYVVRDSCDSLPCEQKGQYGGENNKDKDYG